MSTKVERRALEKVNIAALCWVSEAWHGAVECSEENSSWTRWNSSVTESPNRPLHRRPAPWLEALQLFHPQLKLLHRSDNICSALTAQSSYPEATSKSFDRKTFHMEKSAIASPQLLTHSSVRLFFCHIANFSLSQHPIKNIFFSFLPPRWCALISSREMKGNVLLFWCWHRESVAVSR